MLQLNFANAQIYQLVLLAPFNFFENASKLDPFNDKVTIGQMGLENNNIITVIDDSAIIGA